MRTTTRQRSALANPKLAHEPPQRPLRSAASGRLPVDLPPREPAPAIDWEELRPRSWYPRYGRRLFDLALVVPLGVLAVLPFACVALANLIAYRDPRKVLFIQERVGWCGRSFQIYKFRTMNEAGCSELESWSQGEDRRRVTRLGRFLRNSHLDELPQLINVVRGDMALIGPRPEMLEIEAWAERNVPGFTRRLRVRPGITGLAQITQGYASCDVGAYRRKLEITEDWLEAQSLRSDLKILARTLTWMLRCRGWRYRH
jgi:lipopolysaccharide/colanic/teichoic acid biosynthesis glycosyltransferase